jgi:hypothetical protein
LFQKYEFMMSFPSSVRSKAPSLSWSRRPAA